MTELEHCDRCRREAPAWESPEYVEWEANVRDDGSVGGICPGCLTLEEEKGIQDDMAQLAKDSDEDKS